MSFGSLPAITDKTRAAPRTSPANGPIGSRLDANATRPKRDTRPYVGFNPTTPVSAAGCLIDPPVSLPREAAVISAATATALPPDDPPGVRSTSRGFLAGPNA